MHKFTMRGAGMAQVHDDYNAEMAAPFFASRSVIYLA